MSTTTNGDEYELIEVPVQHKIEINLTLDDLLDAVAQQAASISAGASQAPAQVVDRLHQLGQMASELKGQLPGGPH